MMATTKTTATTTFLWVTKCNSIYESSEEKNDWKIKKKIEQQVGGVHLNLPTYIIQCILPVKCDFGEMN